MPVSREFRDFVLEQLAVLNNVRARAMFGGVGIYADDVFFAIIADDVLYFKVDDRSWEDFEAAGRKPFKPFRDRPSAMAYYELPEDVLEDPEQLLVWSRNAIEAARRSKQKMKRGSRQVDEG